MDFLQSRLKFRQRTPWEAVDLGRSLINSHLTYYMALYAMLMLPFVLIGVAGAWLFDLKGWLLAWIWWLKPVYEYGVLSALSIHAFQPLPPLKTAIKTGFKLMARSCVFGDLTWRRLRPMRSFVLPIQQLEQLSGSDFQTRKRELGRYGGNTATGLTLMGNALEGIWLYALMILAYWFLYGNFIQQGLVQPSHMGEFNNLVEALYDSWANEELSAFFNFSALAYCLTLVFWGPYYVAGGFTLYLNARTQSEAWDIRLTWQRLSERLRSSSWCVAMVVAGLLVFGSNDMAHAEALPDEQRVTQSREQVLQKDPFYHVKQENRWCWLSCDKKATSERAPIDFNPPPIAGGGAAVMQLLGYLVLILLVIGLLFGVWQWLKSRDGSQNNNKPQDAPTSMFGLDLRVEALPKDVSAQALSLLQTDPRAALSLLYRATLSQLINKQHLPVKQHHTEGKVSLLVNQQLPMLSTYFQSLTNAWLRTAYGHQQLPIEDLQQLCGLYATHFEQKAHA